MGPRGVAVRPPATGAAVILVVDDEGSVRQASARALSRLGYRVIAAGDAAEATRIVRHAAPPIALVVSDLVMPGQDGVALYERLRSEGWAGPFLFLSGYDAEDMPGRPLPTGAPVLRKPWRLDDLDASIRRLLKTDA